MNPNSEVSQPPNQRRRSKTKSFQKELEYFALVLMAKFLQLLPLSAVEKIGKVVGSLAYKILGSRRKVAFQNLQLAFGDLYSRQEQEKIAYQSFCNFAGWFGHLFWFGARSESEIRGMMEFSEENRKKVLQAHAKGKGLIILVSHFCHWELMGLCLGGFADIPTAVLAKQQHNEKVDLWLNKIRCRTGNEVIYVKDGNIKILRRLKAGGAVAFVFDQDASPGRGAIPTKFFEEACYTHPGPAGFCLAAGAQILSLYCIPTQGGRFEAHFELIDTGTLSGDKEIDTIAITQACNDAAAVYIRKYPEYYFWFHKRWKHRPEGHRKVYD